MPTARPRTAPPFPGLVPLFPAAALREADARTSSRYGLPSIVLMERAGLESARAILAAHPAATRAVILAGRGNNGGDGWVVARHLAEAGLRVEVMSADGAPPSTADAHAMSNVALALGVPFRPFDPGARGGPGTVVVDALLGTGSAGAPREPLAGMVRWIAGAGSPVVALDVPTGVDADSGRVDGDAVPAGLTLTYHGDMPGLRIEPGRGHCGRVEVIDIGIPSAVVSDPSAWLILPAAARGIPPKAAGGEKYAAGAVLVVAGAPGLTGAAGLAAAASLRAGAGLTVAAVPAPVQPLVAGWSPEVMCAPVPHTEGALSAASVPEVLAQAGRVTAVALGPGIGRAAHTADAVLGVLAGLEHPVVVDADGLWHLVGHLDAVAARPGPTVLTPHSGEAARLLGVARAEVDAARRDAALALAGRSGAVVVLKGPGTLVADPSGTLLVAAGGGPELSTAGSGDVLTGIIAAALAKGMTALHAAAASVALHAVAGREAGAGDGTIAGDLVAALPRALARAGADEA